MLNRVQGSMPNAGMQPQRPQQLTDDQKTKIHDILSNYDADNLSTEDAQAIIASFQEEGINPSRGFAEAVSEAGFDARELGETAGVQGPPPGGRGGPPPGGGMRGAESSGEINFETLESLQSILNSYDLSSITSDQENTLVNQLMSAGLLQMGSLIDLSI